MRKRHRACVDIVSCTNRLKSMDIPNKRIQFNEARQNIAGTALRIGVPLTTEDVVISESGLVETVW